MPHIGIPELIVILVIVTLLFGAKKIPELARSFGTGIFEFKKGIHQAASLKTEMEKQEDPT